MQTSYYILRSTVVIELSGRRVALPRSLPFPHEQMSVLREEQIKQSARVFVQ